LSNVVDIGSRRELFIDRHVIDTLEDASLRLQTPQPAGVALRYDKRWEGPFCGYVSVFKDDDTYRAYYRGNLGDNQARGDTDPDQVTCLAESRNGIDWTKPTLGLVELNGTRENNVVLLGGETSHNFSPFLDTNPGVHPAMRFKALAGVRGLYAFCSADGINWRRIWDDHVITAHPDDQASFDSQNLAFWSVAERCYVCYFRVWSEGVRTIARSTSADFRVWSQREVIAFGDAAAEHFYINQTTPYFRAPHIYVSLAARFVPDRRVLSDEEATKLGVGSANGVGYWHDCAETVLMSSRAQAVFDRTFLEGFVRPGLDRGNWASRNNYAAAGIVPTGDHEMSIFVNRSYAQPGAYLERLALRTDGFASVNVPYAGGAMSTKPVIYEGAALEINYSTAAGGHILVELQDESGVALPGVAEADCDRIIGDEIARVVTWHSNPDVARYAGRAVRIRFTMKDADLYSFRFRPKPSN
jgi:hypothetical protein